MYFASGRLSSFPADLSSVTFLSLSHNRLYGSIPTWIANMSKLQYLDLSFNDLTGMMSRSDQCERCAHTLVSVRHDSIGLAREQTADLASAL